MRAVFGSPVRTATFARSRARARELLIEPDLLAAIRGLAAPHLGASNVDAVRIVVERVDTRPRSRIIRLRAVADATALDLLLKQLVGPGDVPTGPNPVGRFGEPRPRLASPGTLADRYRLEFDALRATELRLERLDDPRFAAVPVLGYVPDHHALLMVRLQAPNLRDLVAREVRGMPGRTRIDLDAAVSRAAAWLRGYHAMATCPLPVRHERREDLLELVARLCAFLGRGLGSPAYFEGLAAELHRLAERCLPERLPLGLAHADFAPRNVLVTRDGRIAVLDMAGGTRIPIFEDVAYFAASLRTPLPRIVTQGVVHDAAAIARLERRFVEAYFEPEPAAWGAIRLYEVLVILDRWWGTPPRLAGGFRGRLGVATVGRLADRFFRSEIERLLQASDHTIGS